MDTSFLVGNAPTPLLNPLEVQAKKLAIQNALAAGGLMQQQLESGDISLQQQRLAARDAAATRAAMLQYYGGAAPAGGPAPAPAPAMAPAAGLPMGPDGSPLPTAPAFDATTAAAPAVATSPAAAPQGAPAAAPVARPPVPTMADLIQKGVPPTAAAGLVKTFQDVEKNAADIEQAHATAAKANGELNGLVQEQVALAAQAVIKSNFNPAVMSMQLAHFSSLGPAYQQMAQQLVTQMRANPAAVPALFQQLADSGKGNREANATEATAAARTKEVDTAASKQQTAAFISAMGGAQNQNDWTRIIAQTNPKIVDSLAVPLTFSPANQAALVRKGESASEQVNSDLTARRDANTAANEKRARDQEQQNINLRAKIYNQQYGNPLENATPAELATAKMRASGTAPLPSPRTKGYDRAIALAAAIDPSFAQYAGTRFQTIQDFRTKGDANNLVAITTALGHLDQAQANSKALGTEPTLGLNWSPTQRRYHQDIYNLTDEIGRLIKSGVVPEGETNRMIGNLTSVSQSNRDAGLDELKTLMGGKFEGIVQKFKNGAGFALPITMFDEPTRQRLVKNGLANGLDMGASAESAPAAPPAAPPAAAPADLQHKSTDELLDMLKGPKNGR